MRRTILLFAVVALVVSLAAPSAQASAPTVTRESIDFSDTLYECGFPVERETTSGHIVSIAWFYADGSFRVISAYPGEKTTLTNLDTGKSIVINNSGPQPRYIQSADGQSFSMMGGGGNLLNFDPEPPWDPGLFLAKGRWVWVFEDGEERTWSIVGDHVDLCPLLASA